MVKETNQMDGMRDMMNRRFKTWEKQMRGRSGRAVSTVLLFSDLLRLTRAGLA